MLLLALVAAARAGGVTLSVWNNSAWSGAPASSEVLPGLAFSRSLPTGTAIELVGTLTLPKGGDALNFSCAFANTSYAFVWIDDHLVCQDGRAYTTVPTSRVDLPLSRLSKADLPVVLRAYTGPTQPPHGPVSYGSFFDGLKGKAGPRVMRYGPQSYGFTPQSCADACASYEFVGLQDVGGRLSRKACGGAAPGTCTNATGYCSCDHDWSQVTSQGKAPPDCQNAVQRCSYVNSVYRGDPAAPPPPAGSQTRTVSVRVSWQRLAPAPYGMVGEARGPMLAMDHASARQLAPGGGSLSPQLPALEVQRRAMQADLATGWATWVFDDMLAIASLPSGLTVRPVLCQASNSSNCMEQLIVNAGGEGGASNVRVGSHSYDRSYAEVESLEFHGLHLRLRWGQTAEGQLIWAATPLNTSTAAASDFVIKFEGSYTWMRAGSVSTSGTSSLVFDSFNLPSTTLRMISSATATTANGSVLVTPLPAEGVALSSDPAQASLASVVSKLEAAAAAQQAIYAKYNTDADPNGGKVRQAIEAAVMWNFIYVPAEAGPFAPVSRGWSFAPGAVNSDFNCEPDSPPSLPLPTAFPFPSTDDRPRPVYRRDL